MNKPLFPKPVRDIAPQFPVVNGIGAVTEKSAIDSAKNKGVITTASAEVAPELKTVTVTSEQFEGMLASAIANITKKEQEKAQIDKDALQAKLDQANSDLAIAQNQATTITNVLTTLGHTHPVSDKSSALGIPAYNRVIDSRSDKTDGLAKDFYDAIASAPEKTWNDNVTGRQVISRDLTEARRLFHSDRANLRIAVERYFKSNGFLSGRAAATLKVDILPGLLDYASMTMRETHSARYVFYQFPFMKLELGKGPGDTIQVPRLRWIPEATALSERTLIPGTALSTTRNNITIAAVSITLAERGLGLAGNTLRDPIGIPEFVNATSLFSLENAVNKVLGRDYQAYVDLSIRLLLATTTRIVFNNGGAVTLVPADVVATRDGTPTRGFLNALYAYMQGLLIPTDDSGHYIIWMPPIPLANLKNSLEVLQQYFTVKDLYELSALFLTATNSEVLTISGYQGSIAGFHIFSSNAAGIGAAGTELVQNTTLGVTSVLTRTCFAMGTMATTRAVGMEAEVRTFNETDGGRLESFFWKSHETTGALDIDPAIAAEQQLRVIQFRVPDRPV